MGYHELKYNALVFSSELKECFTEMHGGIRFSFAPRTFRDHSSHLYTV